MMVSSEQYLGKLFNWRYNLRFLFGTVAILSLVCYLIFSSPYAQRSHIIQKLLNSGAYLEYGEQLPGFTVSKKIALVLHGEKSISKIIGLNFGGYYVDEENGTFGKAQSKACDDDILLLADFKYIRQLNLAGTHITDAALLTVAKLSSLEYLTLDHTKVTSIGLSHLSDLSGLKYLSLTGTRARAEDVVSLQAALPKCKILLNGENESGTTDFRIQHYNDDKTLLAFPDE